MVIKIILDQFLVSRNRLNKLRNELNAVVSTSGVVYLTTSVSKNLELASSYCQGLSSDESTQRHDIKLIVIIAI